MPFARLLQVMDVAHESHAEELREKYRQISYGVWLANMGEESPSFAEYLDALNLLDDQVKETSDGSPIKKKDDVSKEEAMAKATEIMATFKRQGAEESWIRM